MRRNGSSRASQGKAQRGSDPWRTNLPSPDTHTQGGGGRVSGGALNDSSECCILNAIRGKLKLFSLTATEPDRQASAEPRQAGMEGGGGVDSYGVQGIDSS